MCHTLLQTLSSRDQSNIYILTVYDTLSDTLYVREETEPNACHCDLTSRILFTILIYYVDA